jgi:hypothetical protein
LQAKRKSRKANIQEEQLRLLRQILAELQKLNASLAPGRQIAIEPGIRSGDDEELEEYE